MSTTTTTVTTTCNCSGSGSGSKYEIMGPGGPTHPPGTQLTVTVTDLLEGLRRGSGAEYAVSALLLGGLYLNAAESLTEMRELRAGLQAKGYHLLGEGLKLP